MTNTPPPKQQTIAAIDIGSNSAHLVISKVDKEGRMTVLDTDKAILRLGDSVDENNNFNVEAIERTIKNIKHLNSIAISHTPVMRCVATHAMRQAANSAEMQKRVLEETGVAIEIIDGIEEARLSALGMEYGLSLANQSFLAIDIGGGSTETIIKNREKIDFVASLKLGAVVLSKKFLNKEKTKKEHCKKLEEYIEVQLAPLEEKIKNIEFNKAVMSAGTAKALIAMHNHISENEQSSSGINGFTITTKNLEEIYSILRLLKSPKKISEHFNLDSNRGEIILAGTAILLGLSKVFNVKKWSYSAFGLREGIVFDTYSRQFNQSHNHSKDVRWRSVTYLANKFKVNKRHASQVSKIALKIHDQLIDLKKNPANMVSGLSNYRILEAAAYLQECGTYLSFPDHHKHSYYIISNSRLMGFTKKELDIIALIIRFHRKGLANKNRRICRHLSSKMIDQINFFAGILRTATACCRTRQGLVKDIGVELKNKDTIILVLKHSTEKSPETELHKIYQEKKYIEKSLGLNIEAVMESQDE